MPLIQIIAFIVIGALLLAVALKLVIPLAVIFLALLVFGSIKVPAWRVDRMWDLATKAKARRALALQKATAQLLEEKGKKIILGSATKEGFYLSGKVAKNGVLEAAKTALATMRKGKMEFETETRSILVDGFTAGGIALLLVIVLAASNSLSLLTLVLALLAGKVLSPVAVGRVEPFLMDQDMTEVSVNGIMSCDAEPGPLNRWVTFSDEGFFISISHADSVEAEEEE